MKYEKFLTGVDDIKNSVLQLIGEKKLSHAYMIEGIEGTGKKSLAGFIAAALACGGNCNDCRLCDRIKDGLCPDIRIISREDGKKNISIEAVRDMIDDVLLTPAELDFKMYIFDGAETLSAQAQNALLKVIEEPPENVYIILLCEDSTRILTTVRSRVQRIKMPLFSRDELLLFLSDNLNGEIQPDSEMLEFAIRLSGGSPGRAKKLISDGENEYKLYTAAKSVINAQAEKNRGISYFDFISIISKTAVSRDAVESLASYLFSAYRDLLTSKNTGTCDEVFFSKEDTEKFVPLFTGETIMKSIEALTMISRDATYNFNAALAAQTLAVLLWRAA